MSATMITGLLKRALSASLSFSSTSFPKLPSSPSLLLGASLLPLLKTPILLTRSNLLISLVASKPFMIGSWISMSTKWNPPDRHFVTASFPFMALCHRTFRRCMKAPKTRKLIILSSTINTLIGGTELSSNPAGKVGGSKPLCFFRFGLSGRGEATRGVGGVEFCRTRDSVGAGGVGIGGLPGFECLFVDSEADESWRGRCGIGRVVLEGCCRGPVKEVGEAVLLRGYFGRPW